MELIRLRVPAAALCRECYSLRPPAIDWINVIQKNSSRSPGCLYCRTYLPTAPFEGALEFVVKIQFQRDRAINSGGANVMAGRRDSLFDP